MARDHSDGAGISRRTFTGVAAGAAAFASLPGVTAAAEPVVSPDVGQLQPEALLPQDPSLTYMPLDAFAFDTDAPGTNATHARYYADATGAGALSTPDRLNASLPIPTGSVIHQINVAYQGTPILEIWKRPLATPVPYLNPFQVSLPAGGGAKTASYNLSSPITVDANSTMAVRYYTSAGATVYGVTVGYVPPADPLAAAVAAANAQITSLTGQLAALSAQVSALPHPASLVLIAPTRVYDSRLATQASGNAGGRLSSGENRVVNVANGIDVNTGSVASADLVPPAATGIVGNLTIADASGGGFLSMTPGDAPTLTASSINWSASIVDLANAVTVKLDAQRRVKVFAGGGGSVDFIIDVAGYYL
ncbi:MAG: hypothetical protein JWL72_4043 [Ilumatobacteraceae bacterium]|nr:hypothetical protein [Ilumatobacteraceae bacterium]